MGHLRGNRPLLSSFTHQRRAPPPPDMIESSKRKDHEAQQRLSKRRASVVRASLREKEAGQRVERAEAERERGAPGAIGEGPSASLANTQGITARRHEMLQQKLAGRAEEAVLSGDVELLRETLAAGLSPDFPVLSAAPVSLRGAPEMVYSPLLGLALTMGAEGRSVARELLIAGADPCAPVEAASVDFREWKPFPLARFCFLLDDPDGLALLAEFGAPPEGFDFLAPPPTVKVASSRFGDHEREREEKPTGEPAQWRKLSASHWGAESLRCLAPRCAQWVKDAMGGRYSASFKSLFAPSSVEFPLEEGEITAILEREAFLSEKSRELSGQTMYSWERREIKAPERGPRSCPAAFLHSGFKTQMDSGFSASYERGRIVASAGAAQSVERAMGPQWPRTLDFWTLPQARSHGRNGDEDREDEGENNDKKATKEVREEDDFRGWAAQVASKPYFGNSVVSTGAKNPASWEGVMRQKSATSRGREQRWEDCLCEPAQVAARFLLCAGFVAEHDAKNAAQAGIKPALRALSFADHYGVFTAALIAQLAPAAGLETASKWMTATRDSIRVDSRHDENDEGRADIGRLIEQLPAIVEAQEIAKAAGPAHSKARRGPRSL